MSQTVLRICEPSPRPVGQLYIDGVEVDDLFENLYFETRDVAEEFEKSIRFDVISGSTLTVAVDREAISDELGKALRWCIASEETQYVSLTAYPCRQDVSAIFDIQAHLHSERGSKPEDWNPTFGSLRDAVLRMGGEWEPIVGYRNCRRITFRLPQWVCAPTPHLAFAD
jgi:hypothetical protein